MITALAFPAFVMGVLGGAHCAVMCGPVVSAACRRPRASLGFNVGRVVTYGALGAVAGAFGALVPFFAVALRPLAAIALVGLGLHLAGISSLFTNVEKIGRPIWRRLAPVASRPLPAATLGAIWGFVPCGLVYAALAIAGSTGGAAEGAVTMLAFGAGTLPVMTLLGTLAGSVARVLARPVVRRTAGALVLVLGAHQTLLAVRAADFGALGGHPEHTCCAGETNRRP